MGAATYKIIAEQGATYTKIFTLKDSAGALINLTGYTARLQVRENYGAAAALIDLTTENGGIVLGGAAGAISLLITAAQMAALVAPDEPGTPPALVCVYDLELCYGATVTRLLQGKFLIMREVTR